MNDKVLQAVIKLKDEISKPLKSVNSALKSTRSATEGVTDSLDKIQRKCYLLKMP